MGRNEEAFAGLKISAIFTRPHIRAQQNKVVLALPDLAQELRFFLEEQHSLLDEADTTL